MGLSLPIMMVNYRPMNHKELRIYNSLGNKIEVFEPIIEDKVSIYCCGPTVYSSPHIGNFRPVITFDILRRLLMYLGYDVTFVSNYTDVDDKIINKAKELGISEKELSTNVIEEYRKLVDEVGSLQPDITPTPTEYMNQIITYVDELVKDGAAYESDGDVYLKVRDIPDYGELSNNSIENLESGARIAVGEKKEDPLDFALWKKTSDAGIKWETPWSNGRPGWHTECCVMINSLFKEQNGYIDIHGGGFDLKFPHHENEIAQSKAHNHNKLAKYWMHNGFINVDNEKMSKSLGNVILMKDVVEKFGGIAFRLMVLAAHYRAPASFSENTISEAKTKLDQLRTSIKKAGITLQLEGEIMEELNQEVSEEFLSSLCDDLNTPNALSVLYEHNKLLNQALRSRPLDVSKLKESFALVYNEANLLGLNLTYPVLSIEDRELYDSYEKAKSVKDFEKSDEIRKVLIEKGLF